MIQSALNKWRNSWFSRNTIHEESPHAGLFEEGNFKWWMVANWLLHRKSLEGDVEDERVATVYKILKACHLFKSTGMQEEAIRPEDLLERLPTDVVVRDGLTTLTKKFMITEMVV
jgi:hypothetical protein